jgi:hypothetical protein
MIVPVRCLRSVRPYVRVVWCGLSVVLFLFWFSREKDALVAKAAATLNTLLVSSCAFPSARILAVVWDGVFLKYGRLYAQTMWNVDLQLLPHLSSPTEILPISTTVQLL